RPTIPRHSSTSISTSAIHRQRRPRMRQVPVRAAVVAALTLAAAPWAAHADATTATAPSAAAAPAPAAGPHTYAIDRNHSHVGFGIRHLVSRVDGRFTDFAGSITYDAKAPEGSSVEITVQASSIDTATPRRDEDLRSPNFFDVAKFPTLSFKSAAVKSTGAGK